VDATGRIRRPGAGRPDIEQTQPGVTEALDLLVEPLTRGDPMSPLRWTCKSRAKLAAALTAQGWRVSSTTVGHLLCMRSAIARARGSRSCNGWPTTCVSGSTSRTSGPAPAGGTRSSIASSVTSMRIGAVVRSVPLRRWSRSLAIRERAGLRVKAKLDQRRYPTGCAVTHAEMRALALHPHAFHGDWNYELRPRPS
jgi:hypothetical protein